MCGTMHDFHTGAATFVSGVFSIVTGLIAKVLLLLFFIYSTV